MPEELELFDDASSRKPRESKCRLKKLNTLELSEEDENVNDSDQGKIPSVASSIPVTQR